MGVITRSQSRLLESLVIPVEELDTISYSQSPVQAPITPPPSRRSIGTQMSPIKSKRPIQRQVLLERSSSPPPPVLERMEPFSSREIQRQPLPPIQTLIDRFPSSARETLQDMGIFNNRLLRQPSPYIRANGTLSCFSYLVFIIIAFRFSKKK